jgi:hypothetical protein
VNAPPAQAIAPLRERLAQLRTEATALDINPIGPDSRLARLKLSASIAETEALIKRLENHDGARHP